MAIIEKPINLINVANTLGYYEYKPHPVTGVNSRHVDLGRLCTHPNVNKWAKYKPVRFNSVVELTEAQIELTNYGIEFDEFSTIDEIKLSYQNNVDSWSYAKPRGGAFNEHFRAGDFNRYAHDAIQPVAGAFVTPQAQNIENGQTTITGSVFINGIPKVEEIGWEDLGFAGRKLAMALYYRDELVKVAVANKSGDMYVEMDTRYPLPILSAQLHMAFLFLTNPVGGTASNLVGLPNHSPTGYPVQVVSNTVLIGIEAHWNNSNPNQIIYTVKGSNQTGAPVSLLNCSIRIRNQQNACTSTIQQHEVLLDLGTLTLPNTGAGMPATIYSDNVTVNRSEFFSWKMCWNNGGAYPFTTEANIIQEMD